MTWAEQRALSAVQRAQHECEDKGRPMKAQTPPSPAAARAALARARTERASWATALRDGRVTLDQLLAYAQTPQGAAVRKLRLRSILRDTGISNANAARFLRQTFDVLGIEPPAPRTLTVAWLLAPNAAGRRLAAFNDARAARTLPWDGYPLTPPPESRTP